MVPLQGVWTNGSSILSGGLDQCLRAWKLRRKQRASRDTCNSTMPEADDTNGFEVEEAEACAVQVLEPDALHAVQSNVEGQAGIAWTVGIAGRGTQVLHYMDGQASRP